MDRVQVPIVNPERLPSPTPRCAFGLGTRSLKAGDPGGGASPGPGRAGLTGPGPIGLLHPARTLIPMNGWLYERLDSSPKRIEDGPEIRRTTTVSEILRSHETVLMEFRARPGRWILTIEADAVWCPETNRHTGRNLVFVFLEDGESVIGECSASEPIAETCWLTLDEAQALRSIGWNDPLAPWTPNWYFEATSDAEIAVLARLTNQTISEVFGLAEGDQVVVAFQGCVLGEQAN